jgi:hypothetical protein
VTGIAGTTLSLSNVNQTYHTFAAGEQIIVMQMQDTVIGADTAHNTSFGTVSNIVNAGIYEIATISSVAGMPATMTLSGALTHTYNISTKSSVQIISFNSLSAGNYTTSSNITGVAWNGSVGGVVAFQVGGTLTLANSVSANALGFRGGALNSNYEVDCEPTVYDTISSNYGYKGEGIYASPTISYTTQTGRAPLINGGGGGSDDNGGGGGGGNYTAGGMGGQGWTCTTTNASGGFGGVSLGSYISGSRIYMGGGGGSGQQNNSVGTAGVAGGGIVLIKANILTTSCTGTINITANGAVGTTSGNDGAGGGGAGGTIVLGVNSFTVPAGCPLNVGANGGNGGSVGDPNSHGGGGGGGQGAVIYSASIPTVNVTTTTTVGTGGANSASGGATSASPGAGTSNSGILSGPTVLPINFLYFDAKEANKGVLLTWETGVIYQHSLFNIQRSTDGIRFITIGTQTADADGSSTNNFSYTDYNPGTGKIFYRIEEVDLSGAETVSYLQLVDLSQTESTFLIFPNPSPGQFFVRLPGSPQDKSYTVSIMDMQGRYLFTTAQPPAGNLLTVTPDRILPAGVYVILVHSNSLNQTGKLIVTGQ